MPTLTEHARPSISQEVVYDMRTLLQLFFNDIDGGAGDPSVGVDSGQRTVKWRKLIGIRYRVFGVYFSSNLEAVVRSSFFFNSAFIVVYIR